MGVMRALAATGGLTCKCCRSQRALRPAAAALSSKQTTGATSEEYACPAAAHAVADELAPVDTRSAREGAFSTL